MFASNRRVSLFGIDVPAGGPVPSTPVPEQPRNPHPDPHGDPKPDSKPPAGDPRPESQQPPTGDPPAQPDSDPPAGPIGDPPLSPDNDPVTPPAGDPPSLPPTAIMEDRRVWPAMYVPGAGWQRFNPAGSSIDYTELLLMGVDSPACVRH